MNKSLLASSSIEWYTPTYIVEKVNNILGTIDLDPCSPVNVTKRIVATKHFTVIDNGLNKEWFGSVYLNPPYGKEIGLWVNKALYEFYAGNMKSCIMLLPSRTDTRWFFSLGSFIKCFVRGRIKFSNHKSSAPFPSVIVGVNVDKKLFFSELQSTGDIYEKQY